VTQTEAAESPLDIVRSELTRPGSAPWSALSCNHRRNRPVRSATLPLYRELRTIVDGDVLQALSEAAASPVPLQTRPEMDG
jgi:hypothetical protein